MLNLRASYLVILEPIRIDLAHSITGMKLEERASYKLGSSYLQVKGALSCLPWADQHKNYGKVSPQSARSIESLTGPIRQSAVAFALRSR